MRILRFRAWDGKEMWTGFNILPADIIVPPAWKKSKENLEYMQFTGLLDKNSKEIYEGDIVILSGSDIPKVIKFEHGSFSAERIYGGTEAYRMEVIGNIWEHPELLTK